MVEEVPSFQCMDHDPGDSSRQLTTANCAAGVDHCLRLTFIKGTETKPQLKLENIQEAVP